MKLISSRRSHCPADLNRWIAMWGHNYPAGTVFMVAWSPTPDRDQRLQWLLTVSKPQA